VDERAAPFELAKRVGDAWAAMTVTSIGAGLSVRLTLPPHTDKGSAPVPANAEKGRACLASARSGQPATPECPLTL